MSNGKNNWDKAKVIIGVVLGLVAIFTIIYNADCYNVKQAGSEVFATIDTVVAMQQRVEKKFDSWDLRNKINEIADLDNRYGPGCTTCDPKLRGYYNWLVIERDRLIKRMKEGK